MRIHSINQISQLYQQSSVTKSSSVSKPQKTDKVEISSLGIDFQTARAAVLNAPDVRADKVESIKKQIETNTYDVNIEDFASKLVEAYKNRQGL